MIMQPLSEPPPGTRGEAPLTRYRVRCASGTGSRSGGIISGSGSMLYCRPAMPVQLAFFFMLQHLPVELIDQHIDRCVHIGFDRLDVNVLTTGM